VALPISIASAASVCAPAKPAASSSKYGMVHIGLSMTPSRVM
jgi:hypothetical protein